MGPVRSAAMPTLIGSAALAQGAGSSQLPTPLATIPDVQATLCKTRRRLSIERCRPVALLACMP